MKNIQKVGKAIVIGGSITGLMTARVLSSYYEEVILIDKDEFRIIPKIGMALRMAFIPIGSHNVVK